MNTIIKNKEAIEYARALTNPRVRLAVEFGMSLAVRVSMDEVEYFLRDSQAVPIDLLMYAKLLSALFEREDKLRAAMAGRPDEWGL